MKSAHVYRVCGAGAYTCVYLCMCVCSASPPLRYISRSPRVKRFRLLSYSELFCYTLRLVVSIHGGSVTRRVRSTRLQFDDRSRDGCTRREYSRLSGSNALRVRVPRELYQEFVREDGATFVLSDIFARKSERTSE